jgi:2-dehydro-3-deoxygalactonokinase
MTGELFALLTGQGTVAAVAVPADEPDWSAFDGGVDNAMASAGGVGLSGAVFSARTLVLTGQLAPYQVHDYLSGLLIGYELVGVEGAGASHPDTVVVCGEPSLAHRYARALERRGTRVEVLPGDAVATGLWRVAVAAGLVVPA